MKTLLLAVVLIAFSCAKETETVQGIPEDIEQLRVHAAQLVSTTVERTVYDQPRNSIVANGDIVLPIDDVRTRLAQDQVRTARTEQRKHNFLVSTNIVKDIKIYVDTVGVPQVWKTAVNNAIYNWNGANSLLRLRRVYAKLRKSKGTVTVTEPVYDVKVIMNPPSSSVVAEANPPSADGRPGRMIFIHAGYESLDPAVKTYVATHEVGHTFGLMHTNESGWLLIPGTPADDPYSLMNSGTAYFSTLSQHDVTAVRWLYPR